MIYLLPLFILGKDWDSIIPEVDRLRMEEEEKQQQLLDLNLPPRSRKTIQQVIVFHQAWVEQWSFILQSSTLY